MLWGLGNISIAQVAINDDGSAPNPNVMLDVNFSGSNIKGMLIPRMTTAQRTGSFDDAFGANEDGLVVYDTDLKRFFYWNASKSSWEEMNVQGADWSILGNTGIDASTNFLGTTDANDLVFKTDGTERMRITADGKIGIRTSSPDVPLHIYNDGTVSSDDATYDNGTGLLVLGDVNGHNLVLDNNEVLARNNGSSANLYLQNIGGALLIHYDRPVTTHDDGTQFIFTDDGKLGVGFLSPQDRIHIYAPLPYIRFTDSDGGHSWNVGVYGNTGYQRFQITEFLSSSSYRQRLVIKEGGYVGIGTVSPEGLLHIKADADQDATFVIDADAGTDATDTWKIQSNASDNGLYFINDADTRVVFTHGGYVGLGTATPQKPLHLKNSLPYIRFEDTDGGNYWEVGNTSGEYRIYEGTNKRFVIASGGNVGIGVNSPAEILDINGAIKIGNTSNNNAGTIKWDGTNFLGYDGTNWKPLDVQTTSGGGWTDGGSVVYLTTNSDKVGIGTTTPSEKLEVDGNIKLSGEVNRSAQNSADLIPIAYGVISYDANVLSGSGNFTVSHPATGDYRITISGETFNSNDYTVVASARNTTGARIVTVGDKNGDLRICVWKSDGSATDNTFHFVVYKP